MSNYRHGHALSGNRISGTYRSWIKMRQRCAGLNPRWKERYVDRGITVCDRWKKSFANFLADMGERPPGLTLERIDNDRGYEAENCRWATRKEQANNRCAPRRNP